MTQVEAITITSVEADQHNDDYNLTYTLSNGDQYFVSTYVNKNGVGNDEWLFYKDGKEEATTISYGKESLELPAVLFDLDLEDEIVKHFPN